VSGMAMIDRRRLACPLPADRGVCPDDDALPAGDTPGARARDRDSSLAPSVSVRRPCLGAPQEINEAAVDNIAPTVHSCTQLRTTLLSSLRVSAPRRVRGEGGRGGVGEEGEG
jgi:hypothetical protein